MILCVFKPCLRCALWHVVAKRSSVGWMIRVSKWIVEFDFTPERERRIPRNAPCYSSACVLLVRHSSHWAVGPICELREWRYCVEGNTRICGGQVSKPWQLFRMPSYHYLHISSYNAFTLQACYSRHLRVLEHGKAAFRTHERLRMCISRSWSAATLIGAEVLSFFTKTEGRL